MSDHSSRSLQFRRPAVEWPDPHDMAWPANRFGQYATIAELLCNATQPIETSGSNAATVTVSAVGAP